MTVTVLKKLIEGREKGRTTLGRPRQVRVCAAELIAEEGTHEVDQTGGHSIDSKPPPHHIHIDTMFRI